ncbi:MAG: thioesterase family protein [Actinomycetota bacterium]
MHEKRIEIRWLDVDSYQHVNNATYLTYMEEVRDEWFDATIMSVEGAGDFVLVRIAIDFRQELNHTDDLVIAKCRPIKVGRSSITTREEIWSGARGFLASESETVAVAHDPATRKSRTLSDGERAAVEASIAAHADD